MSPSLFNMYMDAMMGKVTEDGAGGVMVDKERVLDLDFADDMVMLDDSWMVMATLGMKMEEMTQPFEINITA